VHRDGAASLQTPHVPAQAGTQSERPQRLRS
jgi:hypothetical protein